MSTIYSVCNNGVVPKIVNNGSPIELNITDVDNYVSGTGKTNDFNLLKYANDSNNIFINFDNETVIPNTDLLVIKLSDLSGSFEKLTADTDPPIDPNWAQINYFRRIFFPQPNTEYIVQIYFFKAIDNTWKCHLQHGPLGSSYTTYIVAENSTVQTTSGIPLTGWKQTTTTIDINIYPTSTNSSLTDKLYVSNLDTTLPAIQLGSISINYNDFNGVYTKASVTSWSLVRYTMNKQLQTNKNVIFTLYKTTGITPENQHWLIEAAYNNDTSWVYICGTSQDTVPMSGWVRTKDSTPNAGGVYPSAESLVAVNINIYNSAYPPSVNISHAKTSDFNGQYFLRVHPDQDASKGNVVYKSNKDKYIIQKTDNTWMMTSSDGIIAVATNSELENKNLGAVPNSNWSSPDSNIAVSGDMIATAKKTETNP